MSSQYQQEQLRPHSYQTSLTAVSRCVKLSTATSSTRSLETRCRLVLLTDRMYFDDGKYNVVDCQRHLVYATHKIDCKSHGPAFVTEWSGAVPLVRRLAGSRHSEDGVCCYRCLSWPTQAADWPTRHRNYGWPDSATVDRVVSNGCDVVHVAHSQCRRDEWMRRRQH